MSCFHGGDAEIMDLKSHLGIKERDERDEEEDEDAFGASRTPTHLRSGAVGFSFVLFLQRLLATICHKIVGKPAGEFLDD